jgi:serine protease
MTRKHLFFVSLLTLFSACGGGGGGGGGGTTPPVPGKVAGTLNVAPTNRTEIEVNDSPVTAQSLAAGESIVGSASATDAGYQGITGRPAVVLQDLYRVTITGENVRLVLTMAQDDVASNDIDLFLLDTAGTEVLTSSEGVDQLTETLTTPGPGTYLVGIRGFNGSTAYLLSAGSTTTSSSVDRELTPVGAEFVTGELLVKYKSSASLQTQATKHGLTAMRDVWNGAYLMKLAKSSRVAAARSDGNGKVNAPGHEANEAIGATLDALRRLRKDPSIEYAEPNYIRRRAAIVPNDEFYTHQWHYPAINLPDAWDIADTRGANTIIAVIDTGILSEHPDLEGQIGPGYDFISSATNAADGDSAAIPGEGDIDSDPEDPGDGPRPGESSFHGTHVAGTVAAKTNNTLGVAGIAWNAKIMPLRVLGKQGGTDADIAEAMKFAARLANASGTLPTTKADVINMSLGGPGFSATTQAVVTSVRNAGVIIVAAAGNENSASPSYPAAYSGVISVSAVGFDLKRAPYSNFGTSIDLAAPGGDTSADLNGDKFADGVLSTLKDDSSTPARFNYVFYQGTSMAAPHMAGVVALMRGVYPQLTPSQLDQLIDGTLPQRITTDLGEPGRDNLFGHGLIDASKAVSAAKALAGTPLPTGSVLNVSVTNLDFDSFLNDLTVSLTNAGTGTLTITSVTVNQPWITVSPTTGVAPLSLNVNVNRQGLTDGNYSATITVISDAASNATKTVPVTIRVSSTASTGNVGEVFVLLLDPATGKSVAQQSTTAAAGYRFTVDEIAPGDYNLVAGTDRDGDDLICDIEDACGTLGRVLTISSGAQLTAIDFPVNNSQNQTQALRKNAGSKPPAKQLR